MIRTVLKPMHPEGTSFVAIFAAVAALLFLLAPAAGWIGAALTVWCYYFFRDPERVPPPDEGLVVSPADGLVSQIGPATPPAELGMADTPLTRVSVFMNVFDCHVNRAPADGTVIRIAYRPGKFLNASLDKASADNERNALRVRLRSGADLAVVQIAGLVARRIVCHAAEGDALATGERFGLIRFGSRLDVYLPEGASLRARPGQTMVAGETVIAELAPAAAPGDAP